MDWPVTYARRARYSDTDPQGIVFNGNYLAYIDDALTDYLGALGDDWSELHGSGLDLVLGHVEIDFRSPARLGETVITGVRAVSVGNTSLVFEVRAWEEVSGRIVIEGRNVQVAVDAASLEKRPVPSALIEAIEGLQGAPLARKAGHPSFRHTGRSAAPRLLLL